MSSVLILRRCITCRKIVDRNQLLKVTRDHNDGVILEGGMGRSAYICPRESCLKEAWRRKLLQKALRCQVNFKIIEILQDRLNSCNDSVGEAR